MFVRKRILLKNV